MPSDLEISKQSDQKCIWPANIGTKSKQKIPTRVCKLDWIDIIELNRIWNERAPPHAVVINIGCIKAPEGM